MQQAAASVTQSFGTSKADTLTTLEPRGIMVNIAMVSIDLPRELRRTALEPTMPAV